MQAKRQMKLFYPTPSGRRLQRRAAATRSIASSENPRRASSRALARPRLRRSPPPARARSSLRLERGHGSVAASGATPWAFEIGADPLVAVAALGEPGGPLAGEALVVDVAGALERLERVGLCGLGDAGSLELRPQTPRPSGHAGRAPGRRARRRARPPALSRAASARPRRHALGLDRLLGLFRLGSRRPHLRPQRRPRPSSSRPSPGRRARRSAAAGRRRSGRRRAAPGSAGGSACVTSGCSRRNAVAFCRPWPSRSSSKLKYEPDFWTIFRSSPASSTVPSQEIPCRT